MIKEHSLHNKLHHFSTAYAVEKIPGSKAQPYMKALV